MSSRTALCRDTYLKAACWVNRVFIQTQLVMCNVHSPPDSLSFPLVEKTLDNVGSFRESMIEDFKQKRWKFSAQV